MKRAATALSRNLDGEVVILDISSGEYFAINEVGAFIWDLLDGAHDLDAIIGAVVAHFDVDHGTASTDVRRLIEDLAAARLVVAEP